MFLISAILMTSCLVMVAQTRTVTGKITSNLDGSAVAGATIRLKGAIAVAESGSDGSYTIGVDERSSDILVFSHPNFDEFELYLGGRRAVDVVLVNNQRFDQYGVPVKRNPVGVEERNGILVFESPDRDYKFWFDLRLQMDGSVFWGETFRDSLNPIANGLELRRVRVAFKAELARNLEAEIDMDFVDGYADPKDIFLKYNFGKNSFLKAGNFKEVFSMETNTTSRYLPFMERPIGTRVLTPSRHLGFQAGTKVGPVLAFGGLHFQDVGDWEVIGWRQTRNRDFGLNEGYSLTGKMVFMPFHNDMDKGLHIGLAGTYRTPKLSSETIVANTREIVVRFDSRSYPNINRKKYLDVRMAVEDYSIGNIEFAGYYKGFRFQSEYTRASINRTQNRGTENFSAFYLMGTTTLFGGRQQYNRNEGEFTRPSFGKEWGDIELALRYEFLDMNSREGSMWGMGEAWTAGINYYVSKNTKLVLNYRFVNHDRYANGANNADAGTVGRPQYVGTDVDGRFTSNPALVTEAARKAGKDYQSLSFRIDVAF